MLWKELDMLIHSQIRASIKIEEDRALYWLSVGAQPSDAVRRLTGEARHIRSSRALRQGESLDMLVSEYTGVPLEPARNLR